MSVSKRDAKFIMLGSVGSSVFAGIATYFLLKKRDEQYEARLAEELQKSIDFLAKQIITGELKIENTKVVTETELNRIEAEPEEEIEESIEQEPLPPIEGERVFPQDEKPPLDQLNNNQKVPYNQLMTAAIAEEEVLPPEPVYEDPDISVISQDIYVENGTEWPQSTLTYFSDAGVLDELGDFVDGPLDLIGTQTPPFGEMSGDPQIVYLRNKRLQREFEVISDPGKSSDFVRYREDIAGDESLQHGIEMLQSKFNTNRRR